MQHKKISWTSPNYSQTKIWICLINKVKKINKNYIQNINKKKSLDYYIFKLQTLTNWMWWKPKSIYINYQESTYRCKFRNITIVSQIRAWRIPQHIWTANICEIRTSFTSILALLSLFFFFFFSNISYLNIVINTSLAYILDYFFIRIW